MIASRFTEHHAGLALLLSSLLLGAFAARADQHEDPPTQVGSKDSNVDKDSSSGSYYPYSAGTVGDDPAEPKSTTLPADLGDSDPGPTDQWGDTADADGDGYLSQAELAEAAPALAGSFGAMDVNSDDKLTRGEFRTWHESRKARATDDDVRSTVDDSAAKGTRPPDDGGN